MTKTKRCPRCWDESRSHDRAACAAVGEAIDAAVERAKIHGLSTSNAAAMAGGMAAYIPVEQLRSAVLAAMDAWGSVGIDLNDVLPYAITCEACGAHEEGEHHSSVDAPTRCQECAEGGR